MLWRWDSLWHLNLLNLHRPRDVPPSTLRSAAQGSLLPSSSPGFQQKRSKVRKGAGETSLESFPLEGHCPAYAKTCVPHTASPYLLPSALMAPSWNLGHGPWLLPWSPLVPRSKSSNFHLHQQALHPISPSVSPSRCAPAPCACLLIQTPQSDLVNVQL